MSKDYNRVQIAFVKNQSHLVEFANLSCVSLHIFLYFDIGN